MKEFHSHFPDAYDDDAPTRSPTPKIEQKPGRKRGKADAPYHPPTYPDRPTTNQYHHLAYYKNEKVYKWTSMFRPREKYNKHECHLCRLIGHIQWNCPDYRCTHCNRSCGHKPENCKQNPKNILQGPSKRGREPAKPQEKKDYHQEPHTLMFARIETNPLFTVNPQPPLQTNKDPPSYDAAMAVKAIIETTKRKKQKTKEETEFVERMTIRQGPPSPPPRPRTARMNAAPTTTTPTVSYTTPNSNHLI